MKSPHIATEVYDSDTSNLLCPRCNEAYLHHRTVRVYDRGENEDLTTVTAVNDGLVASHLYPSKGLPNPSARRDGIAINFECEICSGGITLTLAQHKGHTLIGWDYEEPDPANAEAAELTDDEMQAIARTLPGPHAWAWGTADILFCQSCFIAFHYGTDPVPERSCELKFDARGVMSS
jgi:hypothetical protein